MHVLTVNAGSSSLKFSIYDIGDSERLLVSGMIDRIGVGDGALRASDGLGRPLAHVPLDLKDHNAAIQALLNWLGSNGAHGGGEGINAVGHRIVHGGAWHSRPERVTPALIALLKELVALAPDHLPQEIAAIEAIGRLYPQATQVACFDTAFHRDMPRVAQLYGLPRSLYDEGVLRYGFHGISCQYILAELRAEAGGEVADGRLIVAHLGNGASMIATLGGKSMDVTMGFTPTSGLMMSTRCGDIDPAVVLYLLAEKGMSVDEVNNLLNHRAGLLGVSGTTSDMQDLLARESHDPAAAEAVALFCYQALKHLGALVAALGGLDTLVFTGGIGEHAPAIRGRICEAVSFLGITLDDGSNKANAPVISTHGSAITVRVMKTNEELMIARDTSRVARQGGQHD